jgi:cobalt-zinc-cadmium efflux system membrane fusion protein
MKSKSILESLCCLGLLFALTACEKKFNPADGVPPKTQVVENGNNSVVTVDNPEQFPVVAADQIEAADKLNVTGSVNPDIAREVPVISLAGGYPRAA